MAHSRLAAAIASLGILLAGAGCAPRTALLLDLVDSIEQSETFVETAEFDVGTPDAHPYLVEGWLDQDERWLGRDDETFVWSAAPTAYLRFFSFGQRPLSIVVTLRPNPSLFEAAPPEAEFRVNDGAPVRAELASGWEPYRIEVPPEFLRVGENRLALSLSGRPDLPAAARRLALDRVLIERTLLTYPVRSELEGGANALLLPYLSEIQYQVSTGAGATLELASVRTFGPHGDDVPGHLEVEVRIGEAAEIVLTRRVAAAAEHTSIPLPTGHLRLSLRSIPSWLPEVRIDEPQYEEAVGLLVRRPQVRGPAPRPDRASRP